VNGGEAGRNPALIQRRRQGKGKVAEKKRKLKFDSHAKGEQKKRKRPPYLFHNVGKKIVLP